ncbi:VanZ family protein [Salsuginibacillus kocurii]|uniref:VanZ family protein n=1 Tax=Salsuginibacillus kocurii TaxID=427078 RepID=UPI00035D85D0|nr:VanZ family protein [Salsuginibacillus kocurii]
MINYDKLRRSKHVVKSIVFLLLFLYIGLMLYVTLFAWNYGSSFGPAGPGGRNYNLVPFLSIYRILVFSPDWVDPLRILFGNILLFIPFGFLLSLLRMRKHPLLSSIGMGCFLSIFIEVNQFLFTYRVANIDDVILNSLGAGIGALFALLCFFPFKKRRSR